jgi:hypothetical protein
MNRLKRHGLTAPMVLLAAGLSSGCSDSDPGSSPAPSEDVQLTFPGLYPHAEGNGVFELWISFAEGRTALRHSAAASAGRFRIGDTGALVSAATGAPMVFQVSPESGAAPLEDDGSVAWQLALDAFITFEPSDDPNLDDPNLPGLIGGEFLNGVATMGVLHADALNVDFSSAAGSFHLATPTTSSDTDEVEGVWFAQPLGGAPSLTLPAPPPGWAYEGWLSLGFYGNVSLGRFTNPLVADFDGAGPTPGPLPGYPYPGSDFPTTAVGIDLRPGSVFVTLEPPAEADGEGRSSFLTVLTASLVADQVSGASVPMANIFTALSGTVTIPLQP